MVSQQAVKYLRDGLGSSRRGVRESASGDVLDARLPRTVEHRENEWARPWEEQGLREEHRVDWLLTKTRYPDEGSED